jgi:hypothetical protein
MNAKFRSADQNVKLPNEFIRRGLSVLALVWLATMTVIAADRKPEANEIRILQMQGRVEIMPAGATKWILTQTNQILGTADRLRTGEDSRVTLRWSDQSVLSFAALTEIEILPPDKTDSLAGLSIFKGGHLIFHRDVPAHSHSDARKHRRH